MHQYHNLAVIECSKRICLSNLLSNGMAEVTERTTVKNKKMYQLFNINLLNSP